MNSFLSKLPSWVAAALLGYLAMLVTYALVDNRKVDFWPPSIHPKETSKGFKAESDDIEAETDHIEKEELISSYPILWQITEGPGRNWTGKWQIPSYGTEFACSQTHKDGLELTAKCIVIKYGEFIAVKKFDVSDDNPCTYFGSQAGKTISGKYTCASGGPYDWTVSVL